jgi:hypothetical protein
MSTNSRLPGEVPGDVSACHSSETHRNGSENARAEDSVTHVTPTDEGSKSGFDRAEEMVDRLAERVSSLTSSWGREFLRLTSRARESAQDFWSDVQEFRESKRNSQ